MQPTELPSNTPVHSPLADIRHVTVVLNPTAGRKQGTERRAELERLLCEQAQRLPEPPTWNIVETTGAGTASRLAAAATAEGADIVAAAGGDGTLSEVMNGLIGTGAKLAVLPLGTGNDFIRTLGLPPELPRAVETLFHGRPKPIDIGQVQGRWFLNIAGCGFDAVVAERVNRGFRFLRGTSAYLAAVFLSLMNFRPAALSLTLDGETREAKAMLCSVCIAQYYGGGMRVAPDALLDDGLFDLFLLGDVGKIEFLRAFPRVFQGTHITHPRVTMLRARTVRIESETPLPIFLDGDIIGTTPAEFTLHPKAIEIMAPTD